MNLSSVDAVNLEYLTEKRERELLKSRKGVKKAAKAEKPKGGFVAQWSADQKLN